MEQEISKEILQDGDNFEVAGDVGGISEETAVELSNQLIDALKVGEESFESFSNWVDSCFISAASENFIREHSLYVATLVKLANASFLTRWFYKRKADKLWKKVLALAELIKESKDGKTQTP